MFNLHSTTMECVDRSSPKTSTGKKFFKEWAKALQSGEFTQCQHDLFDGTNYCALGVAGELLCKEEILEKICAPITNTFLGYIPGPRTVDFLLTKNRNTPAPIGAGYLPTCVKIRIPNQNFAVLLNDIEELSFAEIAEILLYMAGE